MKKTYITPNIKCRKVEHVFICASISDITVNPDGTTDGMDAKENSIFDRAFGSDVDE